MKRCGLCGDDYRVSGLNSDAIMEQAERDYVQEKCGITVDAICPACWNKYYSWGESKENRGDTAR